MMYYLHQLSESSRLQRFLLRHLSRRRGSDHRFRDLADLREFRHSEVDLAQSRPTHSDRGRSASAGGIARRQKGMPTMGGVLIIGAVFSRAFFGRAG